MRSSVEQQIIALNSAHLLEIEALLQDSELPYEDCDEHLNNFFGIINGDRLIAVGALQYKGSVALLRSIAVSPEHRGQGLAATITQYLLEVARSSHVRELYLLTETAQRYFLKFGFCCVQREAVPDYIKTTRQFETLCPSSAQAMRLYL